MKRINTERRKPDPENLNKLIYDGQRTVQEVFSELRYRLESTGYLPDEYFILDMDWENGREWPESGDIFCTVDYGGSEGIYLDIYLKYQDDKGKWRTDSLATGKTLGERDEDMDRMYLIASAVTKAFHSDGVHARYARVGEQEADPQGGMVLHLNPEEQKIITDSLIETRQRWKQEDKPLEAIEQLLRRIAGSILEFIKSVGEKPVIMTDYDTASLAIADGDVNAFTAAAPKVPHAYGSLLKQAASRPDQFGMQMTGFLCSNAENIDNDTYLQACKNAIDASGTDKVVMLMAKAKQCVSNLKESLYGDIILHALYHDERYGGNKAHMAAELAERFTPDQIKNADPYLLKLAIMGDNRRLTNTLLDKGISVASEPAMLIYAAAQKKDVYLADRLMKAGADVNSQNHAALRACMEINDPAAGMFLLQLGADFQGFLNSVMKSGADKNPLSGQEIGFIYTLKNYWETSINQSVPEKYENEDDLDIEQE